MHQNVSDRNSKYVIERIEMSEYINGKKKGSNIVMGIITRAMFDI